MFHPDTGDYEFSPEQNATLQRLSQLMSVFGAVSLAWSGLLAKRAFELHGVLRSMTGELYQNSLNKQEVSIAVVQSYLGALLPLLLGIFVLKSASSFRKIVKTEGSDIPNLMAALNSLNSMYLVALVLALVLLFLLVSNVLILRAFF